jgi:hypothetical protein
MQSAFRSTVFPRRWLLWIAAGLLLRLVFIYFPRPIDDDTWDYLQLGHNLLHSGIYGMGSGGNISPSFFRLPGYPLFLATFELLFARIWPTAWLNTVYVAQTLADLASGLLLAALARRHLSPRAAEVSLALAMLCPFTAVYAAVSLTECLSVFAVSLGLYAAGRALAAEVAGHRDYAAVVLAGSAATLATYLRPDGILLFAALTLGLAWYGVRAPAPHNASGSAFARAAGVTALYAGVFLSLLSPWVIRNWITFRVFQPLAPRYINDPGETPLPGVHRWLRTWSFEFVTTANVGWNLPGDRIDLADLPPRAFDSPRQREQTLALIADYNRKAELTPDLDRRFAALADERIHGHLFRYFVALPLLRVADMLLRPRTEAFYLDVFWWRWSEHPGETIAAILLGLIDLAYIALALWGFLGRRVPFPVMLGSYLVLRCLLLATVETPEPRYTLECFPLFIVAAAAALAPAGAAPARKAIEQARYATMQGIRP